MRLVLVAVIAALSLFAQTDLKSIKKILIEKTPNDLDQYIRAEFTKQMKGKAVVVLDKTEKSPIASLETASKQQP